MDPVLHEEWKYKDPNPDRGILLANQIHQLCEQELLISKEYDSKNLRPAAYTLRIGDDYIDSEGKRQKLSGGEDFFVFKKNSIVFVSTKEELDIPYYIIARFNLRVNWVYAGILLGTGPQVDPGFSGKLSCPLYNLTNVDIVITRGEDFATIDFEKTTALLEKYPDAEEKKKKIQSAKDKQLFPIGGETWSFYRLAPMVALKWHKPYKIVSSLIEMKEQVDTWRRLGIGSVIAFLGLTLSLLAFGVNLYRQDSDLNRQNSDLKQQVTDAKSELHDAVQRISNVEKDLGRLESAAKQDGGTSHVPDTGTSKKGLH
jgi:deoxycytidine triphosphate deaminase